MTAAALTFILQQRQRQQQATATSRARTVARGNLNREADAMIKLAADWLHARGRPEKRGEER